MLKSYHNGIVVCGIETHFQRKMFAVLPGNFNQKYFCFRGEKKKVKKRTHAVNNSYKKWNSSPGPFR